MTSRGTSEASPTSRAERGNAICDHFTIAAGLVLIQPVWYYVYQRHCMRPDTERLVSPRIHLHRFRTRPMHR